MQKIPPLFYIWQKLKLGVDKTFKVYIRKQIVEAFFNHPILCGNYIDWHTNNPGECGVTIKFKSTNQQFDIIIKERK